MCARLQFVPEITTGQLLVTAMKKGWEGDEGSRYTEIVVVQVAAAPLPNA